MTTETQLMLAALGDLHDDIAEVLPDIRDELVALTAAKDAFLGDVRNASETLVFVDQTNGNDDNSGLTSAVPLKTLEAAFAKGSSGGSLVIRMMSHYVVSTILNVRQSVVNILPATGTGPFMLSFGPQVDDVSVYSPAMRPTYRATTFRFGNMKLRLGGVSPHVTEAHVFGAQSLTSIVLQSCEVEALAGTSQIFAQAFGGVGISAQNLTITGNMGGRWIGGVAAGALPKDVSVCAFSNLSSL